MLLNMVRMFVIWRTSDSDVSKRIEKEKSILKPLRRREIPAESAQ